jgi:hypothetical protein
MANSPLETQTRNAKGFEAEPRRVGDGAADLATNEWSTTVERHPDAIAPGALSPPAEQEAEEAR